MSLQQTARKEIKAIGLLTFYFAAWFELMLFVKWLVLAQYRIEFRGASIAILGALVVAKIVVVMEYLSLGQWVQRRPVAVDIVLRTLLYTLGVLTALLIEKAFESRTEAGGLEHALVKVFHHREIHQVWAVAICVGGSLLGFNAMAALRRHFGGAELKQLFFATPLAKLEAKEATEGVISTAEEAR